MYKNYLLFGAMLLLIFLSASASFYKHAIQKDYLVSFETACDPNSQSCYEECSDDECTSTYYYAIMERQAHTLYPKCGEDIVNCEYAHICDETAIDCSITFCDPNDEEATCAQVSETKI